MNAQANRLGTVGDNIANASTAGYKKASTQFSSLILPSGGGAYNSGGVNTQIRYSISDQGTFSYTTSDTDLAINGRGFFIVKGTDGVEYLTRAGSFQQLDDGSLMNTAGFKLMGYEYSATTDPTIVINGFEGLGEINLNSGTMTATPSTSGEINANLPSGAEVGFTKTTSLVAFDSQGNPRLLDYVYTKAADNAWTLDVRYAGSSVLSPWHIPTGNVDISGNLDAAAAVGDTTTAAYSLVDTDGVTRPFNVIYTRTASGWDMDFEYGGFVFMSEYIDDSEFDGSGNYIDPFPETIPSIDMGGWSTGPINMSFSSLSSVAGPFSIVADADGVPVTPSGTPITLRFDASGRITNWSSVQTDSISIGGAILNPLRVDITATTQLAKDFTAEGDINGSAASSAIGHEISEDGVVYLKYSDGNLVPRYRIAMADVQSPDKLNPLAGNVYSQSNDSGVIVMGYPANGSYGSILSGALEDSNVDIAEELTAMIEAQRNYTANSKVFQTGSELLEVLVNLKR